MIFSRVLLDSRGQIPNRDDLFHSGKEIFVTSKSLISKIRKTNNLKFCMFTSVICTIISRKFQINPLTVTLFSGSGSKSPPPSPPPPPPVAGKISKCRRL